MQTIPLADADLGYDPTWLTANDATTLYDELCTSLPWEQPRIWVFGRHHQIPRLQSWHGDNASSYVYSGREHTPQPWTAALSMLRQQLEATCQTPFNAVLANWYRDGHDHMGWHSDDESELGPTPVIASLSLGAIRTFRLRRKDNHAHTHALELTNGSLLVMSGTTQRYWQHALPKRTRISFGRINLTYRYINRVE